MNTTHYRHITLAANGVAHIGKTRYKVKQLAAEHYHYGWSAEEILRQHPDLAPAEVYAALAYFYDNHESMLNTMRQEAEYSTKSRARQTLSRATLLGEKSARVTRRFCKARVVVSIVGIKC